MLQNFSLTGKTVLITGSAGLLGVQHALAVLDAGAHVILTDINDSLLSECISNHFEDKTIEDKITPLCMDVTCEASINKALDSIHKLGRRVDVLINNAAIDPKVGPSSRSPVNSSRLENFEICNWNQQINVGLTGAFLTCKIIGFSMASDSLGGNIINISSDLSIIAPDQRLYSDSSLPKDMQPVKPVTYSVIKSGLIGLTKYVSTYWAEDGIRCNALSPGGVYTNQPEDFVVRLSNLIPLGRMATLNEYHGAIQFLASDASSYLNGHNLVIDGGRSIL